MSYEQYRALPVRPKGWLEVHMLRRLGKYNGGQSARELTAEECEYIDGNDLAALKAVFPHAVQ